MNKLLSNIKISISNIVYRILHTLQLPNIQYTKYNIQRGFIKITKKSLVMMLMGVLIFTGSGLYLLMKPKPASAAWYDDNWAYRASLTITHNASDGNKKVKKVKFDIDTATLISAGKMQSDCGDSRFTDINGNLLRYFIDTAGGDCNTVSTDYYVLIPTIINGTTVIYHYYGNPAVANGTESSNFSEDTLTPSGGSAAASEEKAPSPVMYWKLDDGQGTVAQDATTNNLDGTLNNTPAWQTEDMCISGKCLYFDGTNNENVSKSDDGKLDFAAADNFTIGAWVKRNGASSANNFILTKAQTGYTGYKLYQDASGDYCFDVKDGTNTDTACTSAIDFDDNNWHLVQGVKSGTTSITLYVDGKQRAQDASIAATGTLANTGTFYIGVDLDGTSNEWLGFIDEVKVYPYARSAAQILADYNSRGTSKGSSVILGSAATPGSTLSNGLVGYWKMDESSWNGTSGEVVDASGNSNNGTSACTGTGCTKPTTAAGKFGNAGSFDGTEDSVSIGGSASLDASYVTLAAWIKPTALSSIKGILEKTFTYGMRTSGAKITFVADTSDDVWEYYGSNNTNLSTGVWTHIAITYDGATVKFYVNGQPDGTNSTLSGILISSGSGVKIGTESNNLEFGGSIDETRIYNRALSPNEVSWLYNWAPGPRVELKMEEGSGTSTNDSSGNARTGTVNGNPLWSTGKFGKGVKMDGTGDNIQVGDF